MNVLGYFSRRIEATKTFVDVDGLNYRSAWTAPRENGRVDPGAGKIGMWWLLGNSASGDPPGRNLEGATGSSIVRDNTRSQLFLVVYLYRHHPAESGITFTSSAPRKTKGVRRVCCSSSPAKLDRPAEAEKGDVRSESWFDFALSTGAAASSFLASLHHDISTATTLCEGSLDTPTIEIKLQSIHRRPHFATTVKTPRPCPSSTSPCEDCRSVCPLQLHLSHPS